MKNLFPAVLMLFVFLSASSLSYSQNNRLKVTPLKPIFQKMNLTYERMLHKHWSLSADVQFWFRDKKFTQNLLSNDHNIPTRSVNKGLRFSLETRAYLPLSKQYPKNALYVGFGGFTGKHHIERTEFAYSFRDLNFGFVGTSPAGTQEVGRKHGAVDVVSSGIYINPGFQFALWEVVIIDLGIAYGQSWINKDLSALYLIPDNPVESVIKAQEFDGKIKGHFFEPKFRIAYVF